MDLYVFLALPTLSMFDFGETDLGNIPLRCHIPGLARYFVTHTQLVWIYIYIFDIAYTDCFMFT